MSFAGHVMDMINRSNYNRAIVKKHRLRVRKQYQKFLKPYTNNSSAQMKSLSKEEFAILKQKLKKEAKKDIVMQQIIAFFVILCLSFISIMLLVKYIF